MPAYFTLTTMTSRRRGSPLYMSACPNVLTPLRVKMS
jgi:hypothetical protein